MASQQFAVPLCEVDIYPYFGSKYTFASETQLLRVSVNKHIRNNTGGHFSILLSPGGPQGINDKTAWAQILVPNSMVHIRMARGEYAYTVMVGVITGVQESQEWQANNRAGRAIEIRGVDFSLFFTNFSYFTLQSFGLVASNVFSSLGGLAEINGQKGIVLGSPSQAGEAWYKSIMAGDNGILSTLTWNINNSIVHYNDLVNYGFEDYPSTNGIIVPVSLNFLNGEATWAEKFHTLYPFPLYEFFIATLPTSFASSNSYVNVAADAKQQSNRFYKESYPNVVARVNPLPYAIYNPTTSKWSWNSTRWDKLTTYSEPSFMKSNVRMDFSEARNLYQFLPKYSNALLGTSTSNLVSAMEILGQMMDFSSLARFGYRPCIIESLWFSDPAGHYAVQNAANGKTNQDFTTLAAEITSRIASYYEPTPSMYRGSVVTNLRPDIFVGNKFQYAPFKGDSDYLFYIEGVTHNWEFGGNSNTTIEIARGLRVTEYEDRTAMIGLHTGTQHRIDGYIQSPAYPHGYTPPESLTYFIHDTIGNQFLRELPGIYTSPSRHG